MICNSDDARLESLGYKQELKRSFSMFETFGLAFAIIGLLPSMASTLAHGLSAGPSGLVWGWLSCSIFVLMVGIALGELASAIPTTGGLYYWTYYYAPEKWKGLLSFLIAYANTLGNVAGICSINYGCAVMISAAVSIAQSERGDAWSASNGELYGIFLAITICHGLINSLASSINAKLQTLFVVANLLIVFATFIALPLASPYRNEAAFVFNNIQNYGSWPVGFTFLLSWLCPAWTIGGYDSAIHIAEEASNAATAVPYAIVVACGSAGILGFFLAIVIAYCANPDFDVLLSCAQPMATIYHEALGFKAMLGVWCCIILIQFSMGSSIVLSSSRQIWASSRDNALPFASQLRIVGQATVPIRAVWAAILLALMLGLLTLINEAASTALFTLSAAGCYLAYGLPIACRLTTGIFVPGPFYLGRLSKPISWTALCFMSFLTAIFMFPVGGPHPDAKEMNYSAIIYGFTILGPIVYYYVNAHKWFKGPVRTIADGTIEGLELAVSTKELASCFNDKSMHVNNSKVRE